MPSDRGHGAAASLQESSYMDLGQFNMFLRNLMPVLEPRWNLTGFAHMGQVG